MKKRRNSLIPYLIIFLIMGTLFSFLEYRDINTTLKNEKKDNFSNIKEVHFDHMPITYFLDINSTFYTYDGIRKKANDSYEEEKIKLAFKIIENSTENIVQFKEVNNYSNADIRIYGRPPKENSDERFITEGLAGPVELFKDNLIKSEVSFYASKISLYREDVNTFVKGGELWESKEYNLIENVGWKRDYCNNFPLVEIHEILHALGFGHKYENIYSVMSPVDHRIQTCKIEEIDKEIISCLKYIYSNGKKGEDCSTINMYPWGNETEPVDFKWNSLPITYSVQECKDLQKWNLQKAERVIEKYVSHDLYKFQEDGQAQINFYCNISLDSVLLNKETDFWDTTNYFPSAQPIFYFFEKEKITGVKIILFAQDRTCGGIEIHELLHGAGLREHLGIWMKQETEICNTNNMIIDKTSINKIKELYEL